MISKVSVIIVCLQSGRIPLNDVTCICVSCLRYIAAAVDSHNGQSKMSFAYTVNLFYPGSVGPGGVRNFEFARNFEVCKLIKLRSTSNTTNTAYNAENIKHTAEIKQLRVRMVDIRKKCGLFVTNSGLWDSISIAN